MNGVVHDHVTDKEYKTLRYCWEWRNTWYHFMFQPTYRKTWQKLVKRGLLERRYAGGTSFVILSATGRRALRENTPPTPTRWDKYDESRWTSGLMWDLDGMPVAVTE
jgi:hypothetical protein